MQSTIKRLREQKGWDQGQLAEKAGCSDSHVSNVERGTRSCTVGALRSMLRALGATPVEKATALDEVADTFESISQRVA